MRVAVQHPLDKSVKIPGHSEMIILVKIEGQKQNFSWGAVYPSSGGTLFDLKGDCMPVQVANFSASRQKLKQELELAMCEPVATSRVNKGEEPEETLDKVPSNLKLLAEKTAKLLGIQHKIDNAQFFPCQAKSMMTSSR